MSVCERGTSEIVMGILKTGVQSTKLNLFSLCFVNSIINSVLNIDIEMNESREIRKILAKLVVCKTCCKFWSYYCKWYWCSTSVQLVFF